MEANIIDPELTGPKNEIPKNRTDFSLFLTIYVLHFKGQIYTCSVFMKFNFNPERNFILCEHQNEEMKESMQIKTVMNL